MPVSVQANPITLQELSVNAIFANYEGLAESILLLVMLVLAVYSTYIMFVVIRYSSTGKLRAKGNSQNRTERMRYLGQQNIPQGMEYLVTFGDDGFARKVSIVEIEGYISD